jgi:hypothetical protein
MCQYLDTWAMSQNARAALKYISGVGAERRPPRLAPSSEANVMCPAPPRLIVASFRDGVTATTSASKTISRPVVAGPNPSATCSSPPSDPVERSLCRGEHPHLFLRDPSWSEAADPHSRQARSGPH